MKDIKFGVFFVGLVLAAGGAVTAAAAGQDRVEPRSPNVRVLDGRGTRLGVRISDTANGVRIDGVNTGSPAEQAGIRQGDIVVEFDGEKVRSALQLTRLVRETPDGRSVPVIVVRDGQRQTLQATPDNRTAFDFGIDVRIPREVFEHRVPDMVMPSTGLRGRLGVSVQPLTPELAEYFGAKNGGVLVSSVSQDSVAQKAGVKVGDVITSINGRRVNDSGDLLRELRDLTGEVAIAVVRDKKEVTLKATIADDKRGSPPLARGVRSGSGAS